MNFNRLNNFIDRGAFAILVAGAVIFMATGLQQSQAQQSQYLAVKPVSALTKKSGKTYATTTQSKKTQVNQTAQQTQSKPSTTGATSALKPLDFPEEQVKQTASNGQYPPVQLSKQDQDLLSKMEDTLFLQNYKGEHPIVRIERLERAIYGQAVTDNKPVNQRLLAVKQVVLPEQPKAPIQAQPYQPNSSPQYTAQNTPQNTSQNVSVSDATDYPAVTQLESKWFGKTHTSDSLPVRLSRLEMSVFQFEQRGSLADRVANLQMVTWGTVGGNNPAPQQQYQPQPNIQTASTIPTNYPNNNAGNYRVPMPQQNYPQSYPQNYSQQNVYGQPAPPSYNNQPYNQAYTQGQDPQMLGALADMEMQVFKTTFPADPTEVRLSRLESQIFHSTADDMNNEDRLMRVMAVADGNGTDPDREIKRQKTKKTIQTLLPILITVGLMLM